MLVPLWVEMHFFQFMDPKVFFFKGIMVLNRTIIKLIIKCIWAWFFVLCTVLVELSKCQINDTLSS